MTFALKFCPDIASTAEVCVGEEGLRHQQAQGTTSLISVLRPKSSPVTRNAQYLCTYVFTNMHEDM
jgi:hypothetical protein